jgi:hypothetical protein
VRLRPQIAAVDAEPVEGEEDQRNLGVPVEHPLADTLEVGLPLRVEGDELAVKHSYEAAAKLLGEDDVAETVICGLDPERHLEAIRGYEQVGYEHVYVPRSAPTKESFLRFYAEEILQKV